MKLAVIWSMCNCILSSIEAIVSAGIQLWRVIIVMIGVMSISRKQNRFFFQGLDFSCFEKREAFVLLKGTDVLNW